MTYIVLLGFNRAINVLFSIKDFYRQTDTQELDFKFLLVDCKYPLPLSSIQIKNFQTISNTLNIELLNLDKNHGQTGNMCKVFQYLRDKINNDDAVCFFDTDHNIKSKQWLKDALKVLQFSNVDYVTMGAIHHIEGKDQNIANLQGREFVINNVKVKNTTWPGGYPICILSKKFINQDITSIHKYYGGTEYDFVEHLKKINGHGALMVDHIDLINRNNFDPLYQRWKSETIQLENGPDFIDWLKELSLKDEI